MPILAEPSRVARIDVLLVPSGNWALGIHWSAVPGETVATVVGGEAQQLLALVARLPNGEQARCFLPRYGLRVWSEERVLAETAICFRCNNGVVAAPDSGKDWFTFDSRSEPGRFLLQALRRHDPDPDDTRT